jgi:cytochrome c
MTGASPYDSHWKGKAGALAVPPDALAIKAANARRLVGCILCLSSQ